VKKLRIIKEITEKFEDCPPRAASLINSLRAFGYNLGMALADLIDNSIFAEATEVKINYSYNEGDPWVRIIDNGNGMTEEQLYKAMKVGSSSPNEVRNPKDLGRFGLGLKTASWSQCKYLLVRTKTPDGKISTRYWDLDHVEKSNKWEIGKTLNKEQETLVSPISEFNSGTIIVWKKLDRFFDNMSIPNEDIDIIFYNRFREEVVPYLEMVFHKLIGNGKNKINIFVSEHECKPWDPYLSNNNFTQILYKEKYENDRVKVVPYVLPHVSNRDVNENAYGAGPLGWNAQQGFYVYRNNRMIVSGGYLNLGRLKQEEHLKLARIKLDISNDMDHLWDLDVRKAIARPPENIKKALLRIAQATRKKAGEVYKTRSGRVSKRARIQTTDKVWLKKNVTDGLIKYQINLNSTVIKKLLDEVEIDEKWMGKLCYLLEVSIPHREIIFNNFENENCHIDFDQNSNPPEEMMDYCKNLFEKKREENISDNDAIDFVCAIEPFDTNPVYRTTLEQLIEN